MTSEVVDQNKVPAITNADRIRAIIILLRPHQYYKNFLVFFGLFFSRNFFRIDLWLPILLAFVALCLTSSLNYLINDFRDQEKDRHHPEKKYRPFPSGKVSSPLGILMALLLVFLILIILIILPPSPIQILNLDEIFLFSMKPEKALPAFVNIHSKTAFILVLGGFFVTSQVYSLFLKRIVFADTIMISVNYVWRAIAGAVLIAVSVSPWLIILCFITAMMLSLAKRKGDIAVLKDKARLHKQVFEMYTPELLDQSLATISAIELLAIFIYLVDIHPKETVFIVLALPLFTFTIFRYLYLVSSNSIIGRRAERLFFDKQLLLTGIIIVLLFFVALYFPNFLDDLLGIPDPTLE
ncbi:MAG: UbiA prenyltransferase family protein [Candidatus Heimdallarchaeota archaeon]|nr:MAG: UbiA prenyltransferase family protein [Candidatus Heimdallarchaeota archaeon]